MYLNIFFYSKHFPIESFLKVPANIELSQYAKRRNHDLTYFIEILEVTNKKIRKAQYY